MKRFIRFVISFVASFLVLYISGYPNLMNDISESMAIPTFFGSTLVLSVVVMLIWETYLNCMNRICDLSRRVEKLEEENEKLKSSVEEEKK